MLIRLSAFPWGQIDDRQVINLEALQDRLQKDAREVLAPKQLSRLLHVRHRPVQHTTYEGGNSERLLNWETLFKQHLRKCKNREHGTHIQHFFLLNAFCIVFVFVVYLFCSLYYVYAWCMSVFGKSFRNI
jgi:hypothetical protein